MFIGGDIVEENTVEIMECPDKEVELKTCFVITPIGDENSFIRRHIDGVINAAIRPALEENYEVKVAHEFTSPGSINKQVIIEIYTADLVIANLTELNPNVMYELAIRHALRKPVIMIMESGTNKLPFDVVSERTIFYKNDFQGVIDLRNALVKAEESIKEATVISNPIYDALENYTNDEKIIKEIEYSDKESADVLKIILGKMNDLENIIHSSSPEVAMTKTYGTKRFYLNLEYLYEFDDIEKLNIKDRIEIELKDYINFMGDFEIEIIKSHDPYCITIEVKNVNKNNMASRSLILRTLFDGFEYVDKNMNKEVKLLNINEKHN